MTDPTAEEVIAQAFRQLNKPYVLGAEGPTRFDCSGLMYYIFSSTGHADLIGGTREKAAGYAHYSASIGRFSRNFNDAERGDLICYSENGVHVSHIGIYLGNGMAISALVPPYGVREHHVFKIDVAFYGVCLINYPTDPGRTGPDTPGGTTTDPERPTLWTAPPAEADIQILYQGVDITAAVEFSTARFVSQAGGVPGEADLRVRDKEWAFPPGYFHAGGTLELFVNSRREWDGWVMNVNREYAFAADDTRLPRQTPRYWHLEGYDRNFLWSRRYTFDQSNPVNPDIGEYPANSSDREVVIDILEKLSTMSEDGLDLESGITAVGPIDPYEKVKVANVGEQVGAAVGRIGLFNGALFYIDPDRVVRYVDDITDTSPFALSDEPTSGEVGYRDMVINFDGNELYNDAFIWGIGLGSNEPVFARATDDASIADHGLFQYGELAEGMYLQQSVDRRADTLVNGSPSHARGHKDDAVRIQCTIFQPGLRVGYGVSFHSGTWDFGDLNLDPTDLTPDPGAYDKSTEFERFLTQIGKIESNNTYTRQNKRSYAYGRWQVMPANWRVWGPLALGLPRSSGYAARGIDPSLWVPTPTPANQDAVVRWRLGQEYNNHNQDPRRAAAAWRSGPSVASRQPSSWSRGTILYVNHACVPLGYDPVTPDTILEADSEPTNTYQDYSAGTNVDDVYPVRKIEMSFPTPTSVQYSLMLSHELDVAWAYQDPIPTPTPTPTWNPNGPRTEIIDLYGHPGATTEPQPGGGDTSLLGVTYGVNCGGWANRGVYGHNYFDGLHEQWQQDGADSASDRISASQTAPGIYSAIGRGNGLQNVLATVTTNPCGDDAWTNYEDSEQWYGPISSDIAEANKSWPLEIRVAGDPQLIQGYVPSVIIGHAHDGPQDNTAHGSTSFGTAARMGQCINLNADTMGVSYDPNWPSLYGFPAMPAEFTSFVIPVGTLVEGDWITVSPGWTSQRLTWPAFYCDTSAAAYWGTDPVADACANRGPICSGIGQSGSFAGAGAFQSISLTVVSGSESYTSPTSWSNNPTPGKQNTPSTYWTNGQYRTQLPYIPGTLEITWQGVKLTRGVDYEETDPANGIFTIFQQGSGEGSITVTYMPPDGALPTDPLPGEPQPGDPADPSSHGIYRPRVQRQFGWGTPWDGQNCNMAAAAMALDRHTLGSFSDINGTPLDTPPNMRFYSGQTGPNSFTNPGTTIADAVHAWNTGWSESLLNPGVVTFEYFTAQVASGRGAIVQGIETVLPAELKKTNWPDGHAIYINEVLPDGSFWGIDPLYREPLIYPAWALRAYATAFHGGHNIVTCAFTRVTPRV